MNGTRRPSQFPYDELILLRFSNEIRERLDRKNDLRRKSYRKYVIFFFLLIVFLGFFIWSLEQNYHFRLKASMYARLFHQKMEKLDSQLDENEENFQYNRTEKILKDLNEISLNYCKIAKFESRPLKNEYWALFKSTFYHVWLFFQKYSWVLGGKLYEQYRGKIDKKSLQAFAQLKEDCPIQIGERMSRLREQFFQLKDELLKVASRHLKNYAWCQTTWTRLRYDPKIIHLFGKVHWEQCHRYCSSYQTRRCLRCGRFLRTKLKKTIDPHIYKKFFEIYAEAHRRRCLSWKGGVSSFDGLFHLGAYYWRVARVLHYLDLFEKYSFWDKRFEFLRQRWGFQLSLKTGAFSLFSSKADIFLQLWPSSLKAPTKVLQKLSQRALGKTDTDSLWLPAIRFDLLKSIPRHLWYTFKIIDSSSGKKAVFPLIPEPKRHYSFRLSLQKMKIHEIFSPLSFSENLKKNGGNFVSLPSEWFFYADRHRRFLSISERFSSLILVQYPTLPWEQNISESSPYCLNLPKKNRLSPVKSLISLFQIKKNRLVLIKRLPFYSWIHFATLQDYSRRSELLILAEQMAPFSVSNINIDSMKGKLSLFTFPFESRRLAAPRFIKTASSSHEILLPLSSLFRRKSLLKARCPSEHLNFSFESPAPKAKFPQVAIPEFYRTLHVAEGFGPLFYLVRGRLTTPAKERTFILRRSKDFSQKEKFVLLPYDFSQLSPFRDGVFLAGAWGGPLTFYRSKSKKMVVFPKMKGVRYLDPVIHKQEERLFVLQQWRVAGHSTWHPVTTFLLSRPLNFFTDE